MEKIINIDFRYYQKNKKQTTKWLSDIFESNEKDMNLEKQLTNGVYFTILLLNNMPVSVCRFVVFDNRKTVFCSRQVQTVNKFRNKGYAERVLNEGFNFLKENYNCKKVVSYIDKNNKPSLSLHKKIGYIKKEKPAKYYKQNRFSFENSEIFEKKI